MDAKECNSASKSNSDSTDHHHLPSLATTSKQDKSTGPVLDVWTRIGRTHRKVDDSNKNNSNKPKNNGTNDNVNETEVRTEKQTADEVTYTVVGSSSSGIRVHCPLCGSYSKKLYSAGRGLANHLTHVHTPWKPSKMTQKIHRREFEREQRNQNRIRRTQAGKGNGTDGDDCDNAGMSKFQPLVEWRPSESDRTKWQQRMIEILDSAENFQTYENETISGLSDGTVNKKTTAIATVVDERSAPYRNSLPPFINAASNGDLNSLKQFFSECKRNSNATDMDSLRQLLDTKDRHKSTAEHWAAGGGHLGCLKFLCRLRHQCIQNPFIPVNQSGNSTNLLEGNGVSNTAKTGATKPRPTHNRLRRRDGKTPLHYAARNGHVECIRFLLHGSNDNLTGLDSGTNSKPNDIVHTARTDAEISTRARLVDVDEPSGEGTTPLHLACYGGHLSTVRYLIEKEGANVHKRNDWDCSCAHWVAMTINANEDDVRRLCCYLRSFEKQQDGPTDHHHHADPGRTQFKLSFVATQGQGHTPLHKAAQKLNMHVIRWLADDSHCGGAGLSDGEKKQVGRPDDGGHKPSDIWKAMGGDTCFGQWMETTFGW